MRDLILKRPIWESVFLDVKLNRSKNDISPHFKRYNKIDDLNIKFDAAKQQIMYMIETERDLYYHRKVI